MTENLYKIAALYRFVPVTDIEDNGRGMPSTTPTGKSIGLISMAERAREFGGRLSVHPSTAGGACLRVAIPLEDAI